MFLENLRANTGSIFIKFFFFLILLSFIVWGIGDVFSMSNNYIAKIGDKKITIMEFEKAKNIEKEYLKRSMGGQLNEEQIKNFHIDEMVLRSLINNYLINAELSNLNIIASNDLIINQIISNPMFLDQDHRFNREIYDSLLNNNHINEEDFIENIRKEIESNILIKSLFSQNLSLDSFSRKINQYLTEVRDLSIVYVDTAQLSNDKISDKELEDYYNIHKENFLTKEYRDFSYLFFTVDHLKRKILNTEAELLREYEDNKIEYSIPEKRSFYSLYFPTKEKAEDALEKFKNKSLKDFPHIVQSITNKEIKDSIVSSISANNIPKNISDIVFSLKTGEVSPISQIKDGWNLFIVFDIVPSTIQSFKDSIEKISQELSTRKAMNLIYEYSTKIEDELASGASMEEIAHKFDIIFGNVTHVSKDDDNKSLPQILSDNKEIVDMAFEMNENEESSLQNINNNRGYYIVSVSKIISPIAKALNEVENEIRSSIIESKISQESMMQANKIADQIRSEGVDKLLETLPSNVKVKDIKAVQRPSYNKNDDQSLPQSLIEEAFSLDINSVTKPHKNNNQYLLAIVRLKDYPKNSNIINIKDQVLNNSSKAMEEEYLNYLYKKYNVEIKN